jgi:hypothetical protein
MKNIIFLLLISTSIVFGQNKVLNIKGIDSIGEFNYTYYSKFIQVEVQDSIHLEKASSYDYLISIDKDIFPDNDTVYNINSIKEIKIYGSDYKKTKIALEKIFKLRKLDYRYILYSSNSPYKLWYKDNYLVNELSQIKTIEQYRVINVHYKDEDKVEEILFERLLKNAKKKASMIAELSGVKLEKIIEINEDTSNYIIQRRHYLFSNYYKVRAIKVKFSIE